MTTTRPPRRLDEPLPEPQCPSWCEGHRPEDEVAEVPGYQDWTALGDDGGEGRSHAGYTQVVNGFRRDVTIGVNTTESRDGTMNEPAISLCLFSDQLEDLTPAEARAVAAELIRAAHRAERR